MHIDIAVYQTHENSTGDSGAVSAYTILYLNKNLDKIINNIGPWNVPERRLASWRLGLHGVNLIL